MSDYYLYDFNMTELAEICYVTPTKKFEGACHNITSKYKRGKGTFFFYWLLMSLFVSITARHPKVASFFCPILSLNLSEIFRYQINDNVTAGDIALYLYGIPSSLYDYEKARDYTKIAYLPVRQPQTAIGKIEQCKNY